MATIRYVRSWYQDNSREVEPIPFTVWEQLNDDQKCLMHFPIAKKFKLLFNRLSPKMEKFQQVI